MHFWGLTIDVVSAVNVIIAIGLCVDYSGLFKISKMYSWKPGIDFMKRTVPFSSIPDRPHRIILLQIFIHLSDKIDFVCRNILSGIIRQLQQQNSKQNFIQIFNAKLLFISLLILQVAVDCLFSSAHLPRLLDSVRHKEGKSSRGPGELLLQNSSEF